LINFQNFNLLIATDANLFRSSLIYTLLFVSLVTICSK